MIHHIKSRPIPFNDVKTGAKKAEVRFNDRGYKVSDILILEEWDDGQFSGACLTVRVTHIQTGFGLPNGHVVLSIERV